MKKPAGPSCCKPRSTTVNCAYTAATYTTRKNTRLHTCICPTADGVVLPRQFTTVVDVSLTERPLAVQRWAHFRSCRSLPTEPASWPLLPRPRGFGKLAPDEPDEMMA